MTRGLGFLPDDEQLVGVEHRTRHLELLVGAEADVPETFTLAHLAAIQDQGATSSCVGQALKTSVDVRARHVGADIPPVSAKAIYDVARLMRAPHQPLVDAGSQPSAAIEGMHRHGVVSEARWPFSHAGIDEPPPVDVFLAGAVALLGGHYRIPPGRGLAELVRRALAAGFVPCFAMQVDQAYFDYAGGVVRAVDGPVLGAHMQAIVGYDAEAFTVAGSWGTAWGEGGFARLSPALLESATCSSFLVPTVLPMQVS